jgi:predicted phage terminase large subunit-like protein
MPPTILTSKKSAAENAAMIRHLCQTDLFYLTKRILYRDVAIPITAAFHKPVCQFLDTSPHADNLIMLARDHYKTGLLTIARTIQTVLKNPNARCLIATNTGDNADKILSELTGHLFANERLMRYFPDILHTDPKKYDRNTRSDLTVKRTRRTKESTFTAIGVGGDLTGQHFDHGAIDDVVSKENSRSKLMREDVKDWVRVTRSLFEPTSTRDYVGTPWAFDDAWAWLIEQRFRNAYPIGVFRAPCWQVQWRHHVGEYLVDDRGTRLPDRFVTDAAGQPIPAFPERFSFQVLDELRKFKGQSEFSAQYLLDPVDAETTIFPRSKVIILPRDQMPRPENLWVAMTFDPAMSQMGWADFSAFAIGGFDPENRLYLFDLQRGRWTVDEAIDRIYRAFNRLHPHVRLLGIDAVGFQRLYLREFTRAAETRGQYLPIMRLDRTTSNKSKSDYIRPLEALWNNGELILAADLPALDDFLDEAERFRLDRESTHDDMLDAVADLLQVRVRPQGPPRPVISDPYLAAEIETEDTIKAARTARGLPPLPENDLRIAVAHMQTLGAMEEERQTMVSSGGAWDDL